MPEHTLIIPLELQSPATGASRVRGPSRNGFLTESWYHILRACALNPRLAYVMWGSNVDKPEELQLLLGFKRKASALGLARALARPKRAFSRIFSQRWSFLSDLQRQLAKLPSEHEMLLVRPEDFHWGSAAHPPSGLCEFAVYNSNTETDPKHSGLAVFRAIDPDHTAAIGTYATTGAMFARPFRLARSRRQPFGESVKVCYVGWTSMQARETRLRQSWIQSTYKEAGMKGPFNPERWQEMHVEYAERLGVTDGTTHFFHLETFSAFEVTLDAKA